MNKNNIELIFDDKNTKYVKYDDLIPYFNKAIEVLKEEKVIPYGFYGSIQVDIVNDEEIRKINKIYRKIDKPTDVVSLSYFDNDIFPFKNLIGEIFISIDTVKKQAPIYDLSVIDEIIFLFVHGVLHIFGLDHHSKDDKKYMFALQDKIINEVKNR